MKSPTRSTRLALGLTAALVLYGGSVSAQNASVLVVYYSLSGNTERLAGEVAKGVESVEGAGAVLMAVDTVEKEHLDAADAIALGSPTHYANIPGAMKAALDQWTWAMGADLTDKVGGAFSTGGGQVGGKEHVVVSLVLFMLANRMVVAGPLYGDGKEIWGEPGASAMTGPLDPGVSDVELDGARRLGERLARLAIARSSKSVQQNQGDP